MTNYKLQMTDHGFTLIELLVSVAILGLVAGVGGDMIISSVRSYNKSQILNTLSQNGGFAMSTLKNEAKNAASIVSCANTALTIVNKDGAIIIYAITPFSADCSNNGSFTRTSSGNLLNTGSNATVRILPSDAGGTNTSGFVCNGDLVTATLVLAQACDPVLSTAVRVDSLSTTVLKSSVVIRGSYK